MIRPVLSIRLHKLSLLGGSEARKHILDALKKGGRRTKKRRHERERLKSSTKKRRKRNDNINSESNHTPVRAFEVGGRDLVLAERTNDSPSEAFGPFWERLSGARKGLPSPRGKLQQKCCRKRPTRQSRPPPSCPSEGLEASAPNRQTAATMLPGEASQSTCFRVIAHTKA